MSEPKVSVTVKHARDSIANYLETSAPIDAEAIAAAIREAVAAFDIEAAVTRICNDEIERFVRIVAIKHFNTVLSDPTAYAAVLEALNNHTGES